MIEINLIPDVKREFLRTKSMRNFIITVSVFVSAGVVGLALVLGLILSGQLVAEAVQSNSIKNEGKTLTSIEDLNKTVTIQQQLTKIEQQQTSKAVNSRLFDVMTAINPPAPNDIRIALLKMDPNEKTITVEGSAANGYIALEIFKKTITSTKIQSSVGGESSEVLLASNSDITTGDTSFGENAEGNRVLRFSITFKYSDELFAVSEDPVSIITPTGRTDVTDSKLGVPDSLFGQRAEDIEEKE